VPLTELVVAVVLVLKVLIRFFEFVRYRKKNWEYNETANLLFIDFKKDYKLP
jgi:hypothetical protein